MKILSTEEKSFLEALSDLTYCNPFKLDRIEWEKKALGANYKTEGDLAWSQTRFTREHERPNVVAITSRAEELVSSLHAKLSQGAELDDRTHDLYLDLVTYILYYRHFAAQRPEWDKLFRQEKAVNISKNWKSFAEDYRYLTRIEGKKPLCTDQGEHLFSCLYQVRRAFFHIFECILGDSRPIIELRGKVWESIFTHNMRRYQRSLYASMNQLSTLVTGESGTGKELVARSIALAQFIPFDVEKKQFLSAEGGSFIPLNLTALSPTLIESELFGHRKGSFTGAVQDKVGWLEKCGRYGVIFLDEIGELDPVIQVKLLRVLQDRAWSKLGETQEQPFTGKFMAATNRRLADEIAENKFRLDLYYRLCADHIETPSLREQILDRPDALNELIRLISIRLAGAEGDEISLETVNWIHQHLPKDYPWPGNIRELEQCVRNVMVRNCYVPLKQQHAKHLAGLEWLEQIEERTMTIQELQQAYATWVYAETGTYEGAAEKLGIDRRTVKSWIDQHLLTKKKSG